MRKYFLTYPRYFPGSGKFSGAHRRLFESVRDPKARAFYEEQAKAGGWDSATLDRRIRSNYFSSVTGAARQGDEEPPAPAEVFKDIYMFDFADAEGDSAADLTDGLAERLEEFLLEMGRGFAFVERRRRVRVGGEIYPIDLVLFHRGLRCLVMIKIKPGRFQPEDIGALNLVLNHAATVDRYGGEGWPIGLLLCTEKDNTTARYALGGLENRIFVSRYMTELPGEEELAGVMAGIAEKERERMDGMGA